MTPRPPTRALAVAGALATGALLVASVPPLDLGLVAWVAFWPLLVACRGRGTISRAALGCLAGIAFGVGVAGTWLLAAARGHLTADGPSAVALTLAATWLYGGAYIAVLATVQGFLPRPRWLSTPAAWVLLEWVRGFAAGGAPWALLGHSQHGAVIAQLAELGGVPALSFLLMAASAALAEDERRARRAGIAVVLLMVAAASAFGAARLAALPPSHGDATGVELAVLSGRNLAANPVAAYAAATSADAAGAGIVVWPEGAIPGYPQEEPGMVDRLARGPAVLLAGGYRYDGAADARRYFNSVFLFDGVSGIAAIADKNRPVPFGEFSPLPWLIDVPRPFSAAREPPLPLAAGGIAIGPLICWDVLFDDVARVLVRRGADVLVNFTSDRSLGAGAEQLVAFARFRAIETRRWLARASGTGHTSLIDPAGRVLQQDRLRIAPARERPLTFHTRHGHLAPVVAALVLVLCAAGQALSSRGGEPHPRDAARPRDASDAR